MDKTQQQPTDVVGQSLPQGVPPSQQPVVQSAPMAPLQPIAVPGASPVPQFSSALVAPPVAPVGTVAKEQAPLSQPTEYLKPADHTEQRVEISKEMAEAGVEHAPQVEHPQLTVEDKRAGLEPVKASVPISQTTGDSIKLPYTEEQALQGSKNTPIGSSLRWLFEKVLREFKKAHQKLTQKEEQ